MECYGDAPDQPYNLW